MYVYICMCIRVYAARPAFSNTPAHMNIYMCVGVCICMHVCKYVYAVKPTVSIYDREREKEHWNVTT